LLPAVIQVTGKAQVETLTLSTSQANRPFYLLFVVLWLLKQSADYFMNLLPTPEQKHLVLIEGALNFSLIFHPFFVIINVF
jgi:hypothetical protein